MKKTKQMICMFLACLLLPLSGCTSSEDTISELQRASFVMEELEKLQMTQFNMEYLSNLLEFYTDGFPMLSDELIKHGAEQALVTAKENTQYLEESRENLGAMRENIRLMHLPGMDETTLDEIFKIYDNLLLSLKDYFTALYRNGEYTDFQQLSSYYLDEYFLERTRDLCGLYYDSCTKHLENYKGSFLKKRIADDFKNAARLSSSLYQLTNLAIGIHDSVYENYISLTAAVIENSTSIVQYAKEDRDRLDTLSKQLDEFSASAAEFQNTAAEIDVDLSGLDDTIASLKKSLEDIYRLNDGIMNYEKSKGSEIYLEAIDTVSELDKTIAENIRQCSDYNWNVKKFMGLYGLEQ